MELKETASEEHFQTELRTFVEFMTTNAALLKKKKMLFTRSLHFLLGV